ncbi:endonuclease domain-containing protein [Rhodoferax fermentans]|nr:endonuclease domain-containing protein [Rhodoferax fermentans]MBK1683318.1 endonuclease domain-containing protein [Rhodoferax fermentans]
MSQAAPSTSATRLDEVGLGPLSRKRERAGVRATVKLHQSVSSLSPRERAGVRARQLRAKATDAETLLWQRLRSRQLAGYKFRRQHPIGPYFADFACIEARLVVELDGGQHATPEGLLSDERRSEALASQGYLVLRFWNHDVLQQTEAVLESILCGLRERCPHPGPLPEGEGVSGLAVHQDGPHPNPLKSRSRR